MTNLLRCFIFAVATCSSLIAEAQGTVDFANVGDGGAVNAPVYMSDRVTLLTGNQAGYFFGGVQTIDSVQPTATAWDS